MSDPQIPTVDLEDLASTATHRRERAAGALKVGYGEYGLTYVAGHGIPRADVEAVYEEFLAFTERPAPEKARFGGPEIWFQRGWTPPNTEHAVVAGGQPDFKECWFAAPIPMDPFCRAAWPELYVDNVWPAEAPSFRERYLALGARIHDIGLTLLGGCARALDLPEDTFTALVEGGAHVTRALRYLPLDAEQARAGVLWGEEHTDFNLLTLLPGGRFTAPSGRPSPRPDDGSGLYLRTRPTAAHPRGRKLPGIPPAGCIVTQVGQQLEILTGGAFLATPHVITAPKEPGWSRCSLAHFVHVNGQRTLYPLPPFLTPEAIAAYRPPVLAGNYDLKTLVDIGLAPRSVLDRFGYRHYDRLAEIRRQED